MKRSVYGGTLAHLAFSVATLLVLSTGSLFAQAGQAESGNSLFVLPIEGDIEPSTAVFVQRRAEQALAAGASVIVFSIDTFGGRVDSALRISAFIGSIRDAKTVAFVGAGIGGMGVSWSAGALIALSCSEIYMAPGTSIGAAAPVVASPEADDGRRRRENGKRGTCPDGRARREERPSGGDSPGHGRR